MFSEDLDAFLDVDEHADYFVIQRSGKVIRGIIDREYVETAGMASYEPVITCKTSDVDYLKRNDLIEYGKSVFKFIYSQPDGTGMSRLVLNIVSE